MGPVIIETPHLALRAWSPDDVGAIVELFSHPDVAHFVNDGNPATEEQARRFVTRYERIQRERGWCRWALELRADPGRLAGFCGVGCTFAPEIELGWTLRRDLWGNGYATEAARWALDYCFRTVGFERIVSAIDPGNRRSIAVAERLGMKRDGIIGLGDGGLMRYAADNPDARAPAAPGFVRH